MLDTKKAQYVPQATGHPIGNWFIALFLIFAVAVLYFSMTKAFIQVDDVASPLINLTTDNNDAQQVLSKVRMYWIAWPLIIIASIILWAFFTSLKQDPNYPYQ